MTDHRLRLIDAMILISMAALGLAMAVGPYRGTDRETIFVVGGWGNVAKYYGSLAFPCITPLTFALPVLALWRHRGRSRRLFLRPGLGGCVAASAALLLRGLEHLPFFLQGLAWHMGPMEPWVVTGEKVGYAVIGIWSALACAGRWRLWPGWLERWGFAVASLWAAGAFGSVAVVLHMRGGEYLRSLGWFG
jgi:hypothetical protein